MRRPPSSPGAFLLSHGVAAEEAAPRAPPAAPTFNKGDNAWMLTSTVLVLLMTIPGLALFYGGLVRSKNMLSVLAHVFYTVCIVTVIWVIYGYSLAFTGGSAFIGGLDKIFLKGVTHRLAGRDLLGRRDHPRAHLHRFQMTFAAITPALIVGAFAERMKFSAVALFIPLWVTFVYFPIAHMVWYWAGPDAIDAAAKALAAATDPAAKAAAQAKLDEVMADAGLVFQWGAIDFAGGTVVHINAGIAGLVGALLVGKRIGYGKELMAPHSLTLSMVGASLLWVGWFGFNAGSNLEANGGAALAMINSFVATAAAAHVVDVRRMDGEGQTLAARRIVGLRRRPGRGHAGGRLLRPDGRARARPHRRRGVPVLLHHGEERARLRRLRSTCSACTASAASSAPSAPASWSIRRSAAPASWTTPSARSPTTTSSPRSSRRSKPC